MQVYQHTLEAEMSDAPPDPWCTYNDQALQLFTSSLFLAGLFSSFFAGWLTRTHGRKATMVAAALCFLVGAGLNAGAVNLGMLIAGRICLGLGIGCANQVVPLYLSEMAPYNYRGALNQLFQLAVTLGILGAQLINYGLQDVSWGWRLSLGLAGVPAAVLLVGGIMLPESPNSLIERGREEEGRRVLVKLRGTDDVNAEYEDIRAATEEAKLISAKQSFKIMFSKP